MFLKSIRLRHFKCLENLEMDFSNGEDGGKNPVRKTTFLLGENGSGKTALLQAIAMITGGSEALRFLPGFPDDYIQAGRERCEIEAVIATAQGEERQLSLAFERGEAFSAIQARARQTLLPMDAALRHTHRSYFTAAFGSGRRAGTESGRHYLPPGNARYAAVHSLFGRDALLRPLSGWMDELLYKGGPDSVKVLGEALNTFLPEEVRFNSFSEAAGTLLFDTPDGRLPLRQLSNGYQQTVAWVSDLLYHVTRSFGDYKNPLSARGLLLIDEIDLHLHPAWQQRLHSFLNKGLPHFQVIATACSPLTAEAAEAGELFVVKRDAGGKAVLEGGNKHRHLIPAEGLPLAA